MNLNTIQQPLIEALGWTLLHSLWQGLIIAALLAIAIRFIKNKSPKLSYQLCCLSLISLVVWMSNTFIHHFHWPIENSTALTELSPIATSEDFAFFANTFSWQQNIDIFFQSFIQSYANELVMLWLLGVGLFSLKWLGTLYFTYTLKRHNITSAPKAWQKMVEQFSQKLGINKSIAIVQSTKVDVPMVIGYLKPVILIPASLATGFTSEQIESIIVHELAHIKSNDFLIGLILSAMEVVLFYHPMYWWVSGIISEEREKCCDDITVAQCGNPLLYARTLFSIAEQKQQRSLALSLQGKKNQLFDRIKRVCITQKGKPTSNNNRAGMALGFLFVIAIMALVQVPSQAKEAIFDPVKEAFIEQFNPETDKELLENVVKEFTIEEGEDISETLTSVETNIINTVVTDTILPPKSSNKNNVILLTRLDQDGNIYITKKDTDGQAYAYLIKKGEGKIYIDRAELEPGNHRLNLMPETQISFVGTTLILDRDDLDLDNLDKVFDGDSKATAQYYEEAKTQLEDDSSMRKNLKSSKMGIIESGDRYEEVRGIEEIEEYDETLERQREIMERNKEILERQREAIERHKETLERQQEEHQKKMEQLKESLERQQAEHQERMEQHREKLEHQREVHEEQMNLHRERLEENRERIEEDRERLEEDRERREEEHDRRQEHNDKFHTLLSENLYNDGLIKKKTKYKFKLSLDELKVNKKIQSAEIHKKYLELYQNHYNTVIKESSNIQIQRN